MCRLLVLLFFAQSFHLQAQLSAPQVLKVKNYLHNWRCQKALKILGKEPHVEDLSLAIQAHHQIGNYKEVIVYAEDAIKQEHIPPQVWYYYAKALLQAGEEERAQQAWEKYHQFDPQDPMQSIPVLINQASTVDSLLFEVQPLASVNTEADELAPLWSEEALFYQRGKRPCGPRQRIFACFDPKHCRNQVQLFKDTTDPAIPILKKKIEGYSSQPPISNTLITTQTQQNKQGLNHQLFLYSDYKNTKPRGLLFNDPNYQVLFPMLTPDQQQLFFVSNMPGGFGGYDIYVSYYENDSWSVPVNLGPIINTQSDEISPFYKEGLLYFASDGHAGYGGFDIFRAREENGTWEAPINLGPTVNSRQQDWGLIFANGQGYFTSNRGGGEGGYDLYQFNLR